MIATHFRRKDSLGFPPSVREYPRLLSCLITHTATQVSSCLQVSRPLPRLLWKAGYSPETLGGPLSAYGTLWLRNFFKLAPKLQSLPGILGGSFSSKFQCTAWRYCHSLSCMLKVHSADSKRTFMLLMCQPRSCISDINTNIRQ